MEFKILILKAKAYEGGKYLLSGLKQSEIEELTAQLERGLDPGPISFVLSRHDDSDQNVRRSLLRFKEAVEQELSNRYLSPQPQEQILVSFDDLFVNADAMGRALNAAKGIEPPMLRPTLGWADNYKKNPGILAFYEFCKDAGYIDETLKKLDILKAFAVRFGFEKVGRNINNAASYDSKLKGKLVLFDSKPQGK